MKRVLALTAGVLVALVPTGTAFAGTVPGNAYGNCQHSSSGGDVQDPLMPEVGPGLGNGGLVDYGKDGEGCVAGGSQEGRDVPKGPKNSFDPDAPTDDPTVWE